MALRGAFFGVQVLVSRSLGEEAFTYFVAVVIGGSITMALSDLGLRHSLTFEFAADPSGAALALRRPLLTRAILLAIGSAWVGVLVDVIVAGRTGSPAVAVSLVGAYGMESLARCVRVPFRVGGEIVREMRIEVVGRALFVAGLTVGVLVNGLPGAAVAGMAGAMASLGYSCRALSRAYPIQGCGGAFRPSAQHWVFAGVTLVATTYGRADFFIVAGTRGAVESAQYGAVYTIVSGFMVLAAASVEVALGRLGREAPVTRAWLGRATWAVGAVGGLFIATLGPWMTGSVFGTPRDGLTVVCLILGAAFVLMAKNGQLLVSAPLLGRERRLLGLMTVALGVNLGGGLVLIPRYGLEGAAIMTLIAEGILAVLAKRLREHGLGAQARA